MDADIRISGGTVHTPFGPVEADILITGERISGIVSREQPAQVGTTVDATGRHILPGLIDLHCHSRVPGYEYKEDYVTASQAAAVGGITTFTDMPNVEPPTDTVELFEAKREIADRDSIVDFGHFVSPNRIEEIPKFAAAGATGFKIFQVSGGYPHDPRLAMGTSSTMYKAFSEIAKTGLHCSVHPYDQPLMDELSAEAFARGEGRNPATFAKIYTNDTVWAVAVSVLLQLQKATDVRLHLLHTHATSVIRMLRAAKVARQRVTAAVDLKYYHLGPEDVARQGVRAAPGGVITTDPERMGEIWQGINDGTLDVIESDHAPHTLEDLEMFERDPWTGPFGSPQYEYLLSVVLTDVSQGKLSLDQAVRMLSENPARLLGLFPRKGAIATGSDADLAIVDLDAEVNPTDEATYSKCGWTPWVGWKLKGRVVKTFLRGTLIAEDFKIVGKPGYGNYLEGVPQDPIDPRNTIYPGLAYTPRAK
jgi:dihydroorotase